jgi:hypothetical protein
MYMFCEKDLERYQLKSYFYLTFFQRYTVEMEDMLFSGLDLDRVFNMQTKNGRIIFTIKY